MEGGVKSDDSVHSIDSRQKTGLEEDGDVDEDNPTATVDDRGEAFQMERDLKSADYERSNDSRQKTGLEEGGDVGEDNPTATVDDNEDSNMVNCRCPTLSSHTTQILTNIPEETALMISGIQAHGVNAGDTDGNIACDAEDTEESDQFAATGHQFNPGVIYANQTEHGNFASDADVVISGTFCENFATVDDDADNDEDQSRWIRCSPQESHKGSRKIIHEPPSLSSLDVHCPLLDGNVINDVHVEKIECHDNAAVQLQDIICRTATRLAQDVCQATLHEEITRVSCKPPTAVDQSGIPDRSVDPTIHTENRNNVNVADDNELPLSEITANWPVGPHELFFALYETPAMMNDQEGTEEVEGNRELEPLRYVPDKISGKLSSVVRFGFL